MTGENVEKRGLTITVASYYTDFITLVNTESDIFKKHTVAKRLRKPLNLQITYHLISKFWNAKIAKNIEIVAP